MELREFSRLRMGILTGEETEITTENSIVGVLKLYDLYQEIGEQNMYRKLINLYSF